MYLPLPLKTMLIKHGWEAKSRKLWFKFWFWLSFKLNKKNQLDKILITRLNWLNPI